MRKMSEIPEYVDGVPNLSGSQDIIASAIKKRPSFST